MRNRTIALLSFIAVLVTPALASDASHKLPLYAEKLPYLPLSNSMIMSWLATGILILIARIASKQVSAVPKGIANLSEWITESLYDFLEGILGAYLVKKTYWFFSSLFLFIVVTNWLGLFPGVGTIGWNMHTDHPLPLFRGGNADVNMTSAMAVITSLMWLYWAVKENGAKGFLRHIFSPKDNTKGLLGVMLVVVFFMVGCLEIVSICIRPLALTFRLFGNVYAGEQALESLLMMVPGWLKFLPPLLFYFMELLVGFIQALVFTLLTAVFLKLICDHGEEAH